MTTQSRQGLHGWIESIASPTDRPERLGRVDLEPRGRVEARSLTTFTLTFTAGELGVDDTGAVKVAFRLHMDGGPLQMSDPAGLNYVTAVASNGVQLDCRYDDHGHFRPWRKALTIRVQGGYLAPGDRVVIRLGDTSGGSPGFRVQSFAEEAFEFAVLVDAVATGHFVKLDSPTIAIGPGAPARWKAVLPTRVRPGEHFRLGLRAEDAWGNPTDQATSDLRLDSSAPIAGLPSRVRQDRGQRGSVVPGLCVEAEGIVRVTVRDTNGVQLAVSNPLRVVPPGQPLGYWGDLHGQTGETIGINTARQYLEFARDVAWLDVCSHQGNDFQITDDFWTHLNALTREFDQRGRFVVFPGYEWSGNTAVGGDRNIFFRHEGRPIRRSSHALIADRSDLATDCPTAADAFAALAGEDAVMYGHVGGRYADIRLAHDGQLERSVEVHSAWGTFEWLAADAFASGYRVGVVCNSDGHKGRPGASHPGASVFGAYGGLTCFLASELSRDAVFAAMRRRHHYGTTGNRIDLDLRVSLDTPGRLLLEGPGLESPGGHGGDHAGTQEVRDATMGDIVQVTDTRVNVIVEVVGDAPVERVEVRNGTEVVSTHRPYSEGDLGRRLRVVWEGAAYRGRGRRVVWDGSAAFSAARIVRWQAVNRLNPDRPFTQEGASRLTWQAVTTGNFGGFDVWLDQASDGEIRLDTPLVQVTLPLAAIGLEDTTIEAGGLGRRVRVFRLPEDNPADRMQIEQTVALRPSGDNPVWVCVTLENGHQAWSSPVYVFR